MATSSEFHFPPQPKIRFKSSAIQRLLKHNDFLTVTGVDKVLSSELSKLRNKSHGVFQKPDAL
jgi:tRNA/tmRNA/rRNA uracil-C5-methylase (TrmA/RlmC/RlmD family)